ncbi:class I SAM-dependent methyltransferase [Pedobacter sp. G11]|uniref:class I SAM-dependent methyltransferase n=1 Tax=Pedobacter sp. G11 TaxID=2482728 RepID=UPI000F603D21|nr:class I SAM-dependent methyltransferase [Pedobacter sp. G11]AZI25824.1 class I SAM-dependent methyltransferase [Pedobacter sp. G11]
MKLLLDRIKNKIRRQSYNLFLSRFGFGNRVSRSIWEQQFADGTWNYLYGKDEEAHYQYIVECVQDKNGSILDVGCGQGVLYSYLKSMQQGTNYLGIDISGKAIALAKKTFPEATFSQLDFDYSSLEGQFDIIIFNESLYYFNQPLKIIDKCIRHHLKTNGQFIISMCDFKGHDVIWQKLKCKYAFSSLKEIANKKGQLWKVGVMDPFVHQTIKSL